MVVIYQYKNVHIIDFIQKCIWVLYFGYNDLINDYFIFRSILNGYVIIIVDRLTKLIAVIIMKTKELLLLGVKSQYSIRSQLLK
uniref:Uncharacterized protein n=1 Tax=Heterorhabditis bacteriophora TaxID=37862 RepID=A0A1I7W8G4_HETBA